MSDLLLSMVCFHICQLIMQQMKIVLFRQNLGGESTDLLPENMTIYM